MSSIEQGFDESIPRIIHQIWIGTKPIPIKFMDTWKNKHPNFEYIRWTEQEMEKRCFVSKCQNRIDEMEEINGKADIIRWEILYEYGGYFFDADSICIEPIDDVLMKTKCFAGWENENAKPGLIATGTMGFPPKHPLVKEAIEWIKNNCVSVEKTGYAAWITVGPCLLTNMYNTGKYTDMTIFPSYYFLPTHHTGLKYEGHSKIYQYQEWGSTKHNYDIMNQIELPIEYKEPTTYVSVLVPSYNTKNDYIVECLESIKQQNGHFGIEVVWINDGSDEYETLLLELALYRFQKTTRFVKVNYKKMDKNMGVSYCLREGVNMCSNEIIVRMDSDDIMTPNRIQTQIDFMNSHNDCVMCGSNIQMFRTNSNQKEYLDRTNHMFKITWDYYKITKSHWIMNHPTLCYKKSAILEVGNYNIEMGLCEDLELELRVLKKYGCVYNIQENLLYYRIHENQVTSNGKSMTENNVNTRNTLIDKITNQD
jgi:mannosyltransferase OCH1-like enzyme